MYICPLCDEPIDELAGDDEMIYMNEHCHVACVEELIETDFVEIN